MYTDASNTTAEQSLEALRQYEAICKTRPLQSVLSLFNIANARYNSELVAYAKELSRNNRPYILASSICGFSELTKLMLNSVFMFTGRHDIRLFVTLEECQEWLWQQANAAPSRS